MTDLEIFAILGAMLGILAGIILYMFSKILNSPQFKQYAMMFIVEALLTVVLAVALFHLLPLAERFGVLVSKEFYSSAGVPVASSSGTSFDHPADLALAFISYRLYDCYLVAYGQFMVMYGITHAMVGKMHIGGMLPYGPSNHFFWSTLKFLLQILFYATLMAYFLAKLVLFFNAYSPLLIALGIVIRAFEPAKSMGAYLIATGIGLGLVFPITLNVGFSIFHNPVWCKEFHAIINTPEYKDVVNSLYGAVFKEDMREVFKEDMRETGSGISGFLGWLSRLYTGTSMLISTTTTLTKLMLNSLISPERAAELIYSIVATNFFGPLVSFVITLSFINIFTTALGGRISEIGRGFFKLV